MNIFQAIETWDVSVLYWIQENLRSAVLDPVFIFLTHMGQAGIFWIILSVVLLIPKRTRKAGLTAMISMAVCYLAGDHVIKPIVARIRPYDAYLYLKPLVPPVGSFSFPSGHTVSGFGCSLILVRMLPKKAGIPLVILAALIALSRLYVGVHYPSDVIAGFLTALVISRIVWIIYTNISQKRKEKKEAA